MSDSVREVDSGTAYGMPAREYKQNLVEVGPGTPMGELMRRYWQPCFTSEALTSDKPEKVRLLGEDLILFRDKQGRPGLVRENCCHRGTSLFYGRIEDDGIRCCYHGWKFDVKGRCLDQPMEKEGGQNRSRIRQPWYPVEERYGLVYAYMGPPEKKPVLPRWKHLENLQPGEIVEARFEPGYGYHTTEYKMMPLNYNWLQAYENTMDAPHLPWLHYHHSGDQFTGLDLAPGAPMPPYADPTDMVGRMMVDRTPNGVRSGATMAGSGGIRVIGRNEAMIPNTVCISDFIDLIYFVPMDDTHHYSFMIWRSAYKGERSNLAEMHGPKTWPELTPDEHQLSPGDYEAQSSIGALPAHNWEHFTQGDIGIGMLRRRLEEAVRDVAEGRDPPGVSFDPQDDLRETLGHKIAPVEMTA